MRTSLVVLALLPALALALPMSQPIKSKTPWHALEATKYDFGRFVEEFGRRYSPEEYETRHATFNATLEHILKHNRNPSATWKLGVNHMSDWTDAEFKQLLGYKKALGVAHAAGENMATPYVADTNAALPTSVDWRTKGAVTPVKDQGHCGSCWTFAATETMESHWFLKTGNMVELSEQQVASCTSNPKHCGGKGGCEGGIAELAFESVIKAGGIASEWTYPYNSHNGSDFACKISKTATPPAANFDGYHKLPENEQGPIMAAVANEGPLSITVDAASWKSYESGIYNGCNQESPDLDHLVQLVGYGEENGQLYWLVRNSWTDSWGEEGYIRLHRGDVSKSPVCGMDKTPQDGSGCDDGPKEVKVCGTCGILYDVTFPIPSKL